MLSSFNTQGPKHMHIPSSFISVGNFQGRKNINFFHTLLHASCFQKALHTAIPLDKTHYEFSLILLISSFNETHFQFVIQKPLLTSKNFPTTALTVSANNDHTFSLASLFKISLYYQ